MANYVYNYVFCDNIAADYILDDRNGIYYGISWAYNYTELKYGEQNKIILFSTRGMDYPEKMIIPFIEKFKDTIWYCVEENNVQEGKYFWDGTEVVLSIRDMVDGISNQLIEYQINDTEYRTIQRFFISETEMIVQDILQNSVRNYTFSSSSKSRIESFLNQYIEKYDDEYGIVNKDKSSHDILIDWKNHFIDFAAYDSEDQFPEGITDGTIPFTDIQKFLTSLFQFENINENVYLTLDVDFKDVIKK